MELEYIGELLPDGHLSVDPAVLSHIQKGERLQITVQPLPHGTQGERRQKDEMDAAAQRFLARLRNAPSLGQIKGDLTREDIYEDMADEKW